MFPLKQRLRFKKDISIVFSQGNKTYHPLMRLITLPNNKQFSRATVVVSKKVALRAVKRNSIKRILRSQLKKHLAAVQGNYDVILVAQPKAAASTPQQLCNAVDMLFSKHLV